MLIGCVLKIVFTLLKQFTCAERNVAYVFNGVCVMRCILAWFIISFPIMLVSRIYCSNIHLRILLLVHDLFGMHHH